MKKTLLIAVALIVAGSALAQERKFYLGVCGISVPIVRTLEIPAFITGVSYRKAHDDKTTTFGIAPEVGYFISDRFAVGLGVGFNYTSKDNRGTTSNVITWGVNPYARFYAVKADRFGFYLQGGVSYASEKEESASEADTMFYAGIKPGVSYSISDRFTINATFGNLGYFDNGHYSNFELSLSAATLAFGLTISFQPSGIFKKKAV